VVLLCMVPFQSAPKPADLFAAGAPQRNPFQKDFEMGLQHQFAYLLANY
jgi:hypothetical protein